MSPSLPPSLPPLSLSLTLYFSLLYCVSRWISLLLALSRFYCSTLSVIFMHACMHEYPRMNSFIIIRTNHHWIIFNQPQLTIKLVISRREINALFFLCSFFFLCFNIFIHPSFVLITQCRKINRKFKSRMKAWVYVGG